MDKQQAKSIVRMLNAGWPQHPLSEETATLWAARITTLPFEPARAAVVRLMASNKFRPSLSELFELANPAPKAETASEAFQSVLASLAYGRGNHGSRISELASATVRGLGGWGVIGTWQVSTMSFHQRDFTRVFEDVTMRHNDNKRLRIKAPERTALPPAPGDEPAPDVIPAEKFGEMMGGLMARLRGER